MPNWCSTTITFNGSDASELDLLVNEWTSKDWAENRFSYGGNHCWLGNVVLGAGLVESINDAECPSCRGSITYQELNDDEQLVIDTDTAWSPMLQMWARIIKKFKLDLEIIYTSTEPGNGIYYTNDPANADAYEVDIYLCGEDDTGSMDSCIETMSEKSVIAFLKDILDTDETDINVLLQMLEDHEWKSDDTYININKYDFIEIDELSAQ